MMTGSQMDEDDTVPTDRDRWNQRYADRPPSPRPPSQVLTMMAAAYLPDGGKALDVAAGMGRHGIWLARLGFEVTLVDVSGVGLDLALAAAERVDAAVQTIERDLVVERLPHPPLFGPWDVLVCVDYLQRDLFEQFPQVMSDDGILIFSQPTVCNLERHSSPSRRFLLEEGELLTLVPDALEVLAFSEGWTTQGTHRARLVARKIS